MALTHRQKQLLDTIREMKYASIEELSKKLFVSPTTVRRDTNDLKKLGYINREHGGVVLIENEAERPISLRKQQNLKDKIATIQLAINKMPSFKTAFIDNSSTAFLLARQIDFRTKTVVTTSIALATELSKREGVTVISPGGLFSYSTNSYLGGLTLRNLSEMHFNLSILSASSVCEKGAYENSQEQAELKRVAMQNSSASVLLVDKTKFEDNSAFKTASLSEFLQIYTNADDEQLAPLREKNNLHIINH